jgi:hypothetical protein
VVKNWLHNNGVPVLRPWSGNSPDLNHIENCWAKVKKQVGKLQPSSISDLRAKIVQVWPTEIAHEFCSLLINFMPDRLDAVIRAKGGSTKY